MTGMSADKMRELARAALTGQGFPEHLAAEVAEEFVIAELTGRRGEGLGKLASLHFGSLAATPRFTARGAVLSVDGGGANGFLVMRAVALRLIEQCRRDGVALAAVRNFSRYAALYPYTELVARQGLVGVLMNSAGPAAVAPYGSIDPLTGTNPICFSFPTPDEPQTIDFATAQIIWGEIRQAILEGRDLPAGAFLDADGQTTTTPSKVNAVNAFGGAKGWALNLAIEVLAGALVGAPSGLGVRDEFDCGALMLAIDPAATGGDGFTGAVAGLLTEVRGTRPRPGLATVRAPGDRRATASHPADEKEKAEVEVPAATIALLERLATGEDLTELRSNPLMN